MPETFDVELLARNLKKLQPPAVKSQWEAEHSAMITHTQGVIPEDLIRTRRPYEDKVIQEYRIKNFRPITKSATNRALNNIQRIFSKASVDVEWDFRLEELLTSREFEGCDFLSFFNKFVIRRMIEDPNGVLLWWADYPGADNIPVTPEPFLIASSDILRFDDDVFVCLSPEKSDVYVLDGNKKRTERSGNVYFVATAWGYYRISQYGRKSEEKYELIWGYPHQLDMIPAIVLGGEEITKKDRITKQEMSWYASYFSSFVPFADEALHQFSDHQAIMVTSAYPIKEMERQKCPARDCNKGRIQDPETRELRTCSVCDGRGSIVPSSPYGVLLRAEKTRLDEGSSSDVPVLRYISPDVSIVEYSGKHWTHLLDLAEKALNLLFIEEAQSGIAKDIDREDKIAMLDRIGYQVFMVLMKGSLEIIHGLLKGDKDEIVINLPATFIVRSEQSLIEEISKLSGGGVMPIYAASAMVELMRKRFPGDPDIAIATEVLAVADPAFGYSQEDKMKLSAMGAFTDEQMQVSANAPNIVLRIVRTEEVPKDQHYLEFYASRAKEEFQKLTAIPPVIPAPGDDLGGDGENL